MAEATAEVDGRTLVTIEDTVFSSESGVRYLVAKD